MPLKSQRISEIRELSNDERVDLIDTTQFTDEDWARFDAALDEETRKFCTETKVPEDLHVFVDTYNWDKGVRALSLVLDNPACEAATALMMYWKSAPEYYRQFASRDDVVGAGADAETYDLLSRIEAKFARGALLRGALSFDPNGPDGWVGTYNNMRELFVRSLPAIMYEAV